MSKSILLLARALDTGGSERQMAETAKALSRAGWDVHAGCFHDSGLRAQELRKAGIPVVRFPVRSFVSASLLQGLAEFRRYVRRHDIVLTHSFDAPLNLFGTLAAKLFRRRAVLTSQRSFRTLRTPAELRLLRITDKLVDGIVVNCEAIRRHLVADERVPPDRIHLCYNGLDSNTFYPSPVPRPPALSGARTVIGTVCVLRPEKGLSTLVEAFARISGRFSDVKLLIVGSGPMKERLEQTTRELGISASVHFEPATGDVARWLNMMDIFVLPSLSEALSNSLMEAMACGVVPVASSIGGNPELVSNGQRGFLFPPGDAAALAARLEDLMGNEELRRTMAAESSLFIRSEMTIAKSAARMGQIYHQLLDGN